MHIRAAVEANKHVFAEKPIAVDAPGVRSVLATCEMARKRNLSVVSGLCLRYSNAYREMMRRLHDGAIGDLVTLQANDLRGRIWVFPREAGWTDMQWQMRNWYYFTWLCGDFNVEQHVHNLDVCAWAMRGQYPVRAFGLGGRQQRTAPEYGHIYDHFSVTYEYADGAKLHSHTRQQVGCRNDITVYVQGTRGRAEIREGRPGQVITGPKPWQSRGKDNNFFQTEHDELFASIRKGQPINNGEYMCRSTLLAIMGRMAAYTGREITWEQAMNSREDLSPPRYAWDVPLPVPPVAVPGVTQFR
jgi:predicted dehydrogenase